VSITGKDNDGIPYITCSKNYTLQASSSPPVKLFLFLFPEELLIKWKSHGGGDCALFANAIHNEEDCLRAAHWASHFWITDIMAIHKS